MTGINSGGSVNIKQDIPENLKAQIYDIGPLTRRDYTTSPTIVSLSSSSARSTELTTGQYTVISNIDVYILQGGSSVDATTSSNWIPAGKEVPLYVTASSNAYVAGITDSGTGKLFISKKN